MPQSAKKQRLQDKEYIVVVQCDIVKERCSGYLCEYAFTERSGPFSAYPKDKGIRFLPLTCGGCCGRATHRKVFNLLEMIKQKEHIDAKKIAVHFSSCVSFDSYHGPPCPHKEYLKTMIVDKLGLDLMEGSYISKTTEKLRKKGKYRKR